MSTGKPDRGFTIVEVLMFLAVTGVLMMVAMLTIGGSRQKAEFSASVRDFNSSIQGIISEVRTGYFPNKTAQVNCSATASGIDLSATSTPAGQGAHPECVFLGKVLHFGSTPTASVSIITVAGKAFKSVGGDPPDSYFASMPKPVAGTVGATIYSNIDLTETLNLTNGLQVTKVISRNSTDASGIFSTPGAFGIFNSLATTAGGSLSANVVTIPGSSRGDALATTLVNIKNISTNNEPTRNPIIAICLQHGIGGTGAVVIIGFKDRAAYSDLYIANFDTALKNAMGQTASC